MQFTKTSITSVTFVPDAMSLGLVAALTLSTMSTKAATQVTGDEGKIGSSHVILTDAYNTILGGAVNVASDQSDLGSGTIPTAQIDPRFMVVGGGFRNSVNSSVCSTINGGLQNVIQPWVNFSVISGGVRNSISYASGYSTISGGQNNRIENGAYGAAINGGRDNLISGPLPDNTWGLDIASGNLVAGNLYRVTGSPGEYITYDGVQIKAYHGGVDTGLFVAWPEQKVYTESGNPSVQMLSQLVLPDVASGNLLAGHRYRVNGTSGTVTYNGVVYDIGEYFTAVSGVTTYTETNASGTQVANADDPNHYSWIGGGYKNVISGLGYYGAVGGGYQNGVDGYQATVPGGAWNHADGTCSFAAGRHAHANHNGSFVWNDYQPSLDGGAFQDVMSPGANTFSVRASGGIWLGAGSTTPSIPSGRFLNTSTGGYLSTGGAWTSSSDRDRKENFSNVDTREILQAVISLPIEKWNYKAEDKGIKHIGPVAQDFYAAFAVGQDDRHISTIDADGVALASIQALNEILEEKDVKIRKLEERLERLEASLRKQ